MWFDSCDCFWSSTCKWPWKNSWVDTSYGRPVIGTHTHTHCYYVNDWGNYYYIWEYVFPIVFAFTLFHIMDITNSEVTSRLILGDLIFLYWDMDMELMITLSPIFLVFIYSYLFISNLQGHTIRNCFDWCGESFWYVP